MRKQLSMKKVCRLLIIRHGESCNNLSLSLSKDEYEKCRNSNPELTEIGIKQC